MRTRCGRFIPWAAAAIVFLIHLVGNPHYGFFRDELYFIICGFHPQWGYVDQPPVVPLLAAMTQLFGHSLVLLRAVPALFAAAGVYVTCQLVVEFGGGASAEILAAAVYLFAPVLLNFGMKVSPDEVGLWLWPLIALLIVRLVRGANPRLWLLVGLAAGICIESKYSVIFFLVALLAGLAFTPERRILATRWALAGGAIALLIALPNFLWQYHFGFPMIQLLEAGQHGKNVIVGPVVYLLQELLITNLFLAPVWIIGLAWLFRRGSFRFLGYTYVLLIAEMIALHGKHYYPADIYPIVIAAGAVPIEAWTQLRPVLRSAVGLLVLLFGLVFVPMALPILPTRDFIAYAQGIEHALHISRKDVATEHERHTHALPSDWADMHGWRKLAAMVKTIYDSLPPNERRQAVAFGSNYGEAGAVAFFAPSVPVISGHNQFWLWGTRGFSGNVIIDINGDCGGAAHAFRSVQTVATFESRYAIENGISIRLCRGIKTPLAKVWPALRNYE